MVTLTPFSEPTEGVRHSQSDTTALFNTTNLGKGTLYIAESRLSWISSSGNGFSLEYPQISLHAVSRDLTSYPQECLFLMLDNSESDCEEVDESEDSKIDELRFIPDDKGMLDAMFHAMSACQTLHPDPNNSFSEEEEEIDDEGIENDDDVVIMEETDSQMANLSLERQNGHNGHSTDADMDRDCYEDADNAID